MSRGYLDGLEGMVEAVGLQSDLAKACKVVAFATHGAQTAEAYSLLPLAESCIKRLLGVLARAIG